MSRPRPPVIVTASGMSMAPEPDELPTLGNRAVEGEGFAVIGRREPSLPADGSVAMPARY
jgi:hypothetical protein